MDPHARCACARLAWLLRSDMSSVTSDYLRDTPDNPILFIDS